MAERQRHGVGEGHAERALQRAEERGLVLSREQRAAFAHVTEGRGLGIVVGYAGSGKSAMLGVAREAWEDAGYHVRGVALSGIAAENLEGGSGIASRTIASLEYQWAQGRELLSDRDVLVIDEAGMIGTRQMERVLSEAERSGAKVVLVGDPEQLQAIEAGAAFRSLTERHPHVEIREVRRQREGWQREATRDLATGRTGDALEAYQSHGMVHATQSRGEARGALIESWDKDRRKAPDKSSIILTHTNDEVRSLNELARCRLREAGELGTDIAVTVERGNRDFAAGDRVMFLKNDRGLGIKNGTLGNLETVTTKAMTVRLDNGRSVAFDLRDYAALDHGYAATIYKAQGVTVDRVQVLATPGLDRHAAYVALTRHRERVDLHYGRDDFADEGRLARVLSRERAKDMASDYARDGSETSASNTERTKAAPEQASATNRERSIFASFRPLAKTPDRAPVAPQNWEIAPTRHEAVQRYARAVRDVMRMEELGLPVLPHQRQAQEQAGAALDKLRPHGTRDLERAFEHEPVLVSEAAAGRTQRAIRAMQVEAEIRNDPARRADRFVERWQSLDRQRAKFERGGNWSGGKGIRDHMAGMAKSLERDPQMESVLRNRKIELGLQRATGSSITHDLMNQLGLGRGRGLGL